MDTYWKPAVCAPLLKCFHPCRRSGEEVLSTCRGKSGMLLDASLGRPLVLVSPQDNDMLLVLWDVWWVVVVLICIKAFSNVLVGCFMFLAWSWIIICRFVVINYNSDQIRDLLPPPGCLLFGWLKNLRQPSKSNRPWGCVSCGLLLQPADQPHVLRCALFIREPLLDWTTEPLALAPEES